MKLRPETTLFLIESLDGKISTGSVDERDVDKDFAHLAIVKDGLKQYYDIEKTTDLHSLNSGRVLAKVGINNRNDEIVKTPVEYIVIDNKPHLTLEGVDNLIKKSKKLYIVTNNKKHPIYQRSEVENVTIICYDKSINFQDLFQRFKSDYNIQRITIQTGGELNAVFVRAGLIDRVSIVIAPCLIGGINTQSLVGGTSLITESDLLNIKPLKLVSMKKLEHSYIHLIYEVIS